MRSNLVAAALFAAVPHVSAAQAVPEGIHREGSGPTEMCGLVGQGARDLAEKARRSPSLKPDQATVSDRFEVFNSDFRGYPLYQLVVTRPSEKAHPAVTCREGFEEGGSVRMKRSMVCDAGRAECDALFLEFQALDAAMIRDIQEPKK